MTLLDLLNLADDYNLEYGEVEIRLMSGTKWPFEYTVDGAVPETDLPNFEPKRKQEGVMIVYLCEGSQLGYGTKDAWEYMQ